MAEEVTTLVARSTPPKNRKKISFNINEVGDSTTDTTVHDSGNVLNLMFIPMVLQATPHPMVDLNVTRYLPHVNLPIGKGSPSFTLKVAADSCAGVNIGELDYHRAIVNLFPEAVVVFADLRENNQSIGIGGVGGSCSGLTITHAIVYRLPTAIDGQEARLSFGLPPTPPPLHWLASRFSGRLEQSCPSRTLTIHFSCCRTSA